MTHDGNINTFQDSLGTSWRDLSKCQGDIKFYAGRTWVNIYITTLSKICLPDSLRNFKYFSQVWQSTFISKNELAAESPRHSKPFTSWRVALWAKSLNVHATHKEPTDNPIQHNFLFQPRQNTLSCEKFHSAVQDIFPDKKCVFPDGTRENNFFKRLKIQNESDSL